MALIQIIGNRSLGFLLSLAVIINLAVGSLVMNLNPDFYPTFLTFDLNFFFKPIAPVHFWLYSLLVVLLLFAINTAACSLETLMTMITSRSAPKRLLAGFLFHLGLLIALLAHLLEGVYGQTNRLMITTTPTPVPSIGQVYLDKLQLLTHPDGSKKDTLVDLVFTLEDGSTKSIQVSHNGPAFFDFGQREVLLQHGGKRTMGVLLKESETGASLALKQGEVLKFDGGTLTLLGILKKGMKVPFAIFEQNIGEKKSRLFLSFNPDMESYNSIKIGKKRFLFQSSISIPYLMAQQKYNPGLWFMVLATLLILAGSFLLAGVNKQRYNK